MQQTIVRNSESKERVITVATFLRSVEAQLEEHAARQGATLAIERAPADLHAIADENGLHHILLNLVDTASRCVMPGSSIRIWCESNARVVALRMRCAACQGTRLADYAVIAATREVARHMGGDVTVNDGTFTIELRRTA